MTDMPGRQYPVTYFKATYRQIRGQDRQELLRRILIMVVASLSRMVKPMDLSKIEPQKEIGRLASQETETRIVTLFLNHNIRNYAAQVCGEVLTGASGFEPQLMDSMKSFGPNYATSN